MTGVKIDLGDRGGGTITLNGITDVNAVTAHMFYVDTIAGGGGNDKLTGGAGHDTITGLGGLDHHAETAASRQITSALA